MSRKIVLILHNLRSCHNVGSIFRSADAFSIDKIYLTGYTPYPKSKNDDRLPHLATKIDRQIAKTALGAEKSVSWQHNPDIKAVLALLRQDGYKIIALEQTPGSKDLKSFQDSGNIALIVGREVDGIEKEVLEMCDLALEIPMLGQKESLNVSVAAAIAMYQLSQ